MRAAVIGAGRMGRRHIQIVRELGWDLVGVADRSEQSLSLAAEEQGVPPPRLFTSAESLMREARPETVVIATTAPTHADLACQAVKAGAKYVLCEKPMATSLADCDRMLESCRAAGARLAINHQMRYMEQYTEIKRILQETMGGLSSVSVVAGNFGLAMNGTHYFEMFRYMTDEAPAEVSAWFSPGNLKNPRGPEFEDRAGSIRVTTASGKRFYLDAGHDQGHGVRVIYAGRHGQLLVDELAGRVWATARGPSDRHLPTTRYGMPATETVWEIAPADLIAPTKAVLEALVAGGDYPSGEDGRLAVSVLVAGYVSDGAGHVPVRLDAANLPRRTTFPWA